MRSVLSGKEECINPNKCPLCKENNRCLNSSCSDSSQNCWCKNPDIKFSESLLKQIPDSARNKACICKACALAHQ
ncbi:cysteine-rich CWC family protein [Thalassotalea sp. ND16A]|uniref:cysteine-rich CWC family protein n=1 Tax=Thalassotalea sp. ND16A TaxID=1535422 RepID=UPI0009DCCA7F|nr:cysteine-rich CWC family protein [Thalassotalea sp. ND16A]